MTTENHIPSLTPEQRFMRTLDNNNERNSIKCVAIIVAIAALALTAFALLTSVPSLVAGNMLGVFPLMAACFLGIVANDSYRLYRCCQIREDADLMPRGKNPKDINFNDVLGMAKKAWNQGINIFIWETNVESELRKTIILKPLMDGRVWI